MCSIYIYLIHFAFILTSMPLWTCIFFFLFIVSLRYLLYAHHCWAWVSQVALEIKNLPASVEELRDAVWSLGGEDLLEEGMATHSSILAWRIPWTKEPGRLQSKGSQRIRHDWSHLALMHCWAWNYIGEQNEAWSCICWDHKQQRKEMTKPQMVSLPEHCIASLSTVRLPRWIRGTESACRGGDAGDIGSAPGPGRSPREGNGPLQCSGLGIPWTEEPGGLQPLGLQRVRTI